MSQKKSSTGEACEKRSPLHAPPSILAETNAWSCLADNLAIELRTADTIIRAMLRTLTAKQKLKLLQNLQGQGVAADHSTRARERHDELYRYDMVKQRLGSASDQAGHDSAKLDGASAAMV